MQPSLVIFKGFILKFKPPPITQTRKFLSHFRGIAEVVKEFMQYIADSPLLAHNEKFDIWLEGGGLEGIGASA